MDATENKEPPLGAADNFVLSAYSRIVQGVCAVAFALATILILVDFALIGAAVLLRYVFATPVTGSDELVAFSLVAIVMLGAPEVLRRNGHIGVDILVALLSPRAARWAAVWSSISVILVGAVLVINGWKSAALSRMIGSLTDGHLEWPVWLLQSLLPIGGLLLGMVALEMLWRLLSQSGRAAAPGGDAA